MLNKFNQEEAEIDRYERQQYDLIAANEASKKAANDAKEASFKKMDEDLMAKNPKGWACVMKKLPRGSSPTDATDRDMEKCAKAFNGK